MIATLLPSINSLTSSTEARSFATGPVFFKSQLTISSAVRPPAIALFQKFSYHAISTQKIKHNKINVTILFMKETIQTKKAYLNKILLTR
jgi:hypothetical protein